MALKIWYDQEPENDFGPGDPPLIVHTVAELDAFVDRVLQETAEHAVPSMIEVSILDSRELRVMEVGLGQERGFVNFVAADGGRTLGDPSRTGVVIYSDMSSATEVNASAEIPIAIVRQGLREFLEGDGAKPTSLTWEPALEIWYDQAPDNDSGPGDPPIVVHSSAELDGFVDRVLRETAENVVPPMIGVSVHGDPTLRSMEVGLGPERGFINFMAPGGGRSVGDPTRTGWVIYDCMGASTEVEAWAEIPLASVRQALHEFFDGDGAKPSSVTWKTMK